MKNPFEKWIDNRWEYERKYGRFLEPGIPEEVFTGEYKKMKHPEDLVIKSCGILTTERARKRAKELGWN